MFRQAATTATDLACRAFGRRQVVRATRFVLRRACLDLPNDLNTNGESSLQQWILNLSSRGRRVDVLDVGANVGQWSEAMIAIARRDGRLDDLGLHAFEPSSYTFALLTKALAGQSVTLQRVAMCDRPGSAYLYVMAPGAGVNSLHGPVNPPADMTTEEVTTTTLDLWASHIGLEEISLVKIDTEGHDLAVLRGAGTLLREHRILAVQFEYNHRWIAARSFLRDAFELFEPLGYNLGKLTPLGVEFYRGWDVELETFVEGNYVACVPEVAERLPSVTWWKSAS